MVAVSWQDRYDKRERVKGNPKAGYTYHLGGEPHMGQREMTVEVHPSYASFNDPNLWDLVFHGPGSATIQEIHGLDKALRVGLYLYDELAPEVLLANERRDRQRVEDNERRTAKDEAERPAREAAARERAKALKAAPIEDATQCPECSHVGDAQDFEERVYECSRCGQTLVGEDGRRCDQCNIFTAKVGDAACPNCGEAVEPVEVQAKRIGNELVAVD